MCFCLFFFWLSRQHAEVPEPRTLPRPGIEPTQQPWPEPLQWQCQVLNPLSHKGNFRPSWCWLCYAFRRPLRIPSGRLHPFQLPHWMDGQHPKTLLSPPSQRLSLITQHKQVHKKNSISSQPPWARKAVFSRPSEAWKPPSCYSKALIQMIKEGFAL